MNKRKCETWRLHRKHIGKLKECRKAERERAN